MSVHTGTHIDAPFHYGPTSQGRPAKQILDVPLEWLRGTGIVIDGTSVGPTVTGDHVVSAIEDAGLLSLEGVIPLIRTDADLMHGTPAYFSKSVAIAPSAISELLNRGARVVGTDAWSLDPPARHMLTRYFDTGNGEHLWPAHMLGRTQEFIAIECLANLRTLPPTGFTVTAFPIALCSAGGAWTRAVAEIHE